MIEFPLRPGTLTDLFWAIRRVLTEDLRDGAESRAVVGAELVAGVNAVPHGLHDTPRAFFVQRRSAVAVDRAARDPDKRFVFIEAAGDVVVDVLVVP